eukprot:9153016-Pyramimonas_sp.AAC.1
MLTWSYNFSRPRRREAEMKPSWKEDSSKMALCMAALRAEDPRIAAPQNSPRSWDRWSVIGARALDQTPMQVGKTPITLSPPEGFGTVAPTASKSWTGHEPTLSASRS